MYIKAIKTAAFSFALAAAFLVAAGAADSSSAFAQGLQKFDRDRDGRFDRDRDGRFDRDRDGRVETFRERLEERKGFNDGLVKGRRDALAHRRFNPLITHRRFVSNDYREGFHKGYAQAYRQFARNKVHFNGRGY